MTKLKKFSFVLGLVIGGIFTTACSRDKYPLDYSEKIQKKAEVVSYNLESTNKKSNVISSVKTDKKVLTLTFQGLGNEESLNLLLDELDKNNVKAIFFVSGIKVAEEPELANLIINRGHELGNATLSGQDLTEIDYEQKVIEIKRSHDEIKKYTGIDTKYLRVGKSSVDDEVQKAAAACGYDNIISYNINPQDWDGKTEKEISNHIFENKKRGSIVLLNLDKNPYIYKSIKYIVDSLDKKSFEIISMDNMIDIYNKMNKYKFELSKDWVNNNRKNYEEGFKIIDNGPRKDNKIALTFDDWAKDDTVDSILDTLDKYNIKATFFLRAKGVENNPSLAYAISQRGHEVASHTYNHIDLDKLTDEQIKEDIIKAHEVISNAIGKESKRYLRPPRGIMNEHIAKIVGQAGYEDIIMYDNPSALDWIEEKNSSDIANHVIRNTIGGDIILLHILENIQTPEALPTIIEALLKRGFEFVTVGELIDDN